MRTECRSGGRRIGASRELGAKAFGYMLSAGTRIGVPSALKERPMSTGLCVSAWLGESCSKTFKHTGSEHFIRDAQIVQIRARPYPNVCRSFRAGHLLTSVPR